MSKTTNKFSPVVRNPAIRMVPDHEAEHASRRAAVSSIAAKIGCSPAKLVIVFVAGARRYERYTSRPNCRSVRMTT
jgi:hypothetical protein